jgi:hypothetical protein
VSENTKTSFADVAKMVLGSVDFSESAKDQHSGF